MEHHLETFREPGRVPELQGRAARRVRTPELLQAHWSPATRVVAGALGAAGAIAGARLRGAAGAVLGVLGAASLARAVTDTRLGKLLGLGAGRGAVRIQKTIEISRPVSEVFSLWRNYESFPKFMARIAGVEDLGEGRSRWTAKGPGGKETSWTARITRFEPNAAIAWETESGALAAHRGTVRFQALSAENSRVDVTLEYTPPAGALGHTVAAIFGADAGAMLDEDLLRLKTLLERGKTTSEGREVSGGELLHH